VFLKPRRFKAEAKILVVTPCGVIDIIIKSLRPELESNISDRSKVLIEASERGLILKVEAEDVTALRAAVNSYLYWINGIIEIGSRIST
jgi:tRNA threonylcarbamoyladenosine modification (KEOPS) complex  Pcc1 subunit